MREILFRGKDIKGNWHIGLLAHIGNAWYISNNAGVATAYEVIPSTIGQYTGLTDKNGTKIFEGDIVKAIYDSGTFIYKVVFINGIFGLVVKNGGYDCPLVRWAKNCIEVIGNIHDNPELLKRR